MNRNAILRRLKEQGIAAADIVERFTEAGREMGILVCDESGRAYKTVSALVPIDDESDLRFADFLVAEFRRSAKAIDSRRLS